jgi:hypothetical protein
MSDLHKSYKIFKIEECCGTCKFINDDESWGSFCMNPKINKNRKHCYDVLVNEFTGKCDLYEPKRKKE